MASQVAAIEVTANATGFSAAFSRAAASAKSSSNAIISSIGGIKTAFATLGVSLSLGGLGLFVKSSIDAADRLNDLSKRAGTTATTFGGIGFAAQQAGGDLEGAATAFKKFNQTISDALGGNKEAVENFRKLGISVGELRSMSPDQVLIKTADAFSQFADGAERSSGMAEFFGKGFASVAGILDEGGDALRKNIEYFKRYSGVTEDLVRRSDEFNDSLTKLQLLTRRFGTEMAAALLPQMQALVNYLLNAKENSTAFQTAASGLVEMLKTIATASAYAWYYTKSLGDAIAYNAILAEKIATRDIFGAVDLWKERQANVAGFRKELQAALDLINAPPRSGATGFGGAGTDSGVGSPGKGKKRTPTFGDKGGGAKKEVDEFARMLERVKEMAGEADAELKAMLSTEKITQAEKALAKLQQSEAFNKLPAPRQEQLVAWYQYVAAVEKQQEALKASSKEWDDQTKAWDDARESHAKLVQSFKDGMANYSLTNSIMEREIALIGQDDAARQKLAATIEFEAMAREASKLGMTAEIETLRQQLEERKALIDKAAEVTRQFNNTETLRLTFSDAFADEVANVVSGTKSLADAFKDMERAIVQSISRIAAQNIADAIFGKSGSSGGMSDIFGMFAKLLFGVSGGSSATIPMQPGGGYANGTNFAPGGMALVGERGPEIVNLPRGSKVTPNHKIGGNVVSININVPAGTTSASADRIAVMTGQAVNRALRRNA